ncbi:MAG TPA: CHAD domain-containing protein [Candidatus Eisenbacteria bacterium]
MTRPDIPRLTANEFHAMGPYRWLADALDRQRQGLESAVRRLESPGHDDEAIHDLRVSTRRILGLLAAASDYVSGKSVRRLERRLKRTRRTLGPARDAEVGAGLLKDLRDSLPSGARGAAGIMAAELLARRATLENDGGDRLRSLKLRKMTTGLTRIVRDLEDRDWPVGDPPLTLSMFRARALATLRERWDDLRGLPVEPIERHDAEAQHGFRIAGKKLRYTLELFAPLFPKPIERRLALLKLVQDQLGHLHDLAALSSAARHLSDRAREGGLPEEALDLAELAHRLDDERHRGLDGFRSRYEALVHPGFLPPEAPPAAAPDSPPTDASTELRVIDGGREESA